MVPAVGSTHVGAVEVAVTVGALPEELILTLEDAWQLPATLLTTITVYAPSPTLVNVGEDWKFVPSIE
jgi:hypothetical protein